MKLVYRLLLFSLALVTVLTAFVMLIVDMRLRDRIISERAAELSREAMLVGGHWEADEVPGDVVERASKALGGRVSLIDKNNVIVADAATGGLPVGKPGATAVRPEVQVAQSTGIGVMVDPTDDDGSSDLYVAVKTEKGIVRVGVEMSTLDRIFDQARKDVATAGFVGITIDSLAERPRASIPACAPFKVNGRGITTFSV